MLSKKGLSVFLGALFLAACGKSAVTAPAGSNGAAGSSGAAGAPGATGATGPLDARVPDAPTGFHVTPAAGGPPDFVLHWSLSSSGPVVSSLLVYQSAASIDANTLIGLSPIVKAGGALQTTVRLDANTGVQHFALRAVSVTGVPGTLSANFVIDTTLRVVASDLQGATPIITSSTLDPSAALISQTTVTSGSAPLLSPDGTQIAFIDANGNLLCTPVGGGSVVAVSDPGFGTLSTSAPAMAWSPDSSQLAYFAKTSGGAAMTLLVAPAGGGSSAAIVANGGETIMSAAWSPDSSTLAYFASDVASSTSQLFSVPVSGGTATRLDPPPSGQADTSVVGEYAWLPDGSGVVFVHNDVGLTYVSQAGSARQMADNLAPQQTSPFCFSPDGTRLAIHSAPQALWVGPASGNGFVRLASDVASSSPIVWSNDGQHLAYATNTGVEVIDLQGVGVFLAIASPKAFAFSSDGLLVAVSDGTNLDVVGLSGSLYAIGGSSRNFIAWSPVGDFLAWASPSLGFGVNSFTPADVTIGQLSTSSKASKPAWPSFGVATSTYLQAF